MRYYVMVQPLPLSLIWQKEDTCTFLPVFMSVILFEIYWFTTQSARIKAFFYNKFEHDLASAYHITFLRLFGFVFCVLTLESGTIWFAVSLHVALAWTNGFTALRYQPEMQYLRSAKLVQTGFREST
jgi:hypothetical protein